MESAEFLVIGAGIAGASAAAELAVRGHKVLLLEAEAQAGYHASGRSVALFIEMYGNRVIRGLTRASREQLFNPPPEFADAPLTSRRGALYIASADQTAKLEAFAAEDDVKGAVSALDGDQVRALCPILRPDYVVAGLLDSDAADIDANGLHQGYLRQLRRHNGKMLTSKRVNVISRENDLWTVEAGGEQFSAPILINAAGAWADEVARMAGLLPIGMQPKRRTAVLVDPPAMADSRAWPLVIDIDEQFYFKPDAGQLLLSPADETDSDPCDAQPEELDIALAVERVMQAADITVRRIRHSWAGLRTFAEDRSPVVGFDPLMPGFFWLSGQGGYGLQTAPAMARVTAALACREAIPDSIAAFGVTEEALSPTRFRRTSPR